MTSYKELGLVNTVELFRKAVKGGFAIPAYNFNNLEQLQAIVSACVETKSPVIRIADLEIDYGPSKYANPLGLSSTMIDFSTYRVQRAGVCFEDISNVMQRHFGITLQK